MKAEREEVIATKFKQGYNYVAERTPPLQKHTHTHRCPPPQSSGPVLPASHLLLQLSKKPEQAAEHCFYFIFFVLNYYHFKERAAAPHLTKPSVLGQHLPARARSNTRQMESLKSKKKKCVPLCSGYKLPVTPFFWAVHGLRRCSTILSLFLFSPVLVLF